MAEAGNLFVRIGARTAGLTRGLKKAQRSVRRTSRKMQRAGAAMTTALSAPIALVGGAAVKEFADFDQAMQESIAIMGDVSDAMRDDMAGAAKQVATSTTFAADAAAESFYFLASAGLDAEQSIAALPQVAEFAQAGMFDLQEATDLLTDAQSALGLTVDDAAQNLENMKGVADVLVAANQQANASVEQFSQALTNRAAPALRSVNKSMEEGVAVLAAFAKQGIKGRKAGSQLARILRLMSSAAAENTEEFRDLGLIDADGNLASLSKTVEILTDELGDLSDTQQSARLEQLGFTARVQQSIKPLLGASNEIENYRDALEDAGGAAQEVADKQLQSFTAQLELLGSQIKVLGVELGRTLAPAVSKMADRTKSLVTSLRSVSDETRKWVTALGTVAAAIGPILFVGGKLLAMLTTLAYTVLPAVGSALATAFAFATTPIGLIIGGITAIGAAAAAVIYKWEALESFFGSFFTGLADMGRATGTVIKEFFLFVGNKILQFFTSILSSIGSKVASALAAMGFEDAADTIGMATTSLPQFGEKAEAAAMRGKAAMRAVSAAASNTGDAVVEMGEKTVQGVVDATLGARDAINEFMGFAGGAGGGSQEGSDQRRDRSVEGAELEQLPEPETGGDGLFNITSDDLASLENANQKLREARRALEKSREASEQQRIAYREMGAAGRIAVTSIQRAMGSLFDAFLSFGDEIKSVKQRFKEFGQSALNILSQVASQLASALATAVLLQAAIQAFSLGSIGGVSGVGNLFGSLLGFAKGGLVTGPTLAMVGEGTSTSASNPEVVAPLDKLAAMLGQAAGEGPARTPRRAPPDRTPDTSEAQYTSSGVLIPHEKVIQSSEEGQRRRRRSGRRK